MNIQVPTTATRDICSFSGEYMFLSNFFIEPDSTHVEGEYQMEKCASIHERAQFKTLAPRAAKKAGRKVRLRSDWDSVKVEIMYLLLKQKFTDHQVLEDKLLATGNVQLVEGNYWNDTFWGVCNGVGENHLGKILMRVREELREERKQVEKIKETKEINK